MERSGLDVQMAHQFHLLAVEDEEADARFIARAVAESELVQSFWSVDSGEAAKAYLLGEEPYADRSKFPIPDLLLLDLKLRRMPGLELLRWMRQQPSLRSMPVVVLSGAATAPDLNRAYELGIEAYVVKPADLRGLASTLSGVLVTLASAALHARESSP